MNKWLKTFLYLFFCFSLISCSKKQENKAILARNNSSIADSATYWYLKHKEEKLTDHEKSIYLNKALKFSNMEDSLYPRLLKAQCANYSSLKEYNEAVLSANLLAKYAASKKDSNLLSNAYFRLGYFYSKKISLDSAFLSYQKAQLLALAIKDSVSSAQIFGNISHIQNSLGDFVGAQKSAVKAIRLLQFKTHQRDLSRLYMVLGNAFQNNYQHNEAEKAYKDALQYATQYIDSLKCKQNIALNYKKRKDYPQAILQYKELLSDNRLSNYPTRKARILDNYGHSQFLFGKKNALSLLLEGLGIRQENNDQAGLFASNIHLSEYYINKNEQKAFQYANESYKIAVALKSPDAKLEALSYLIQLKPKANKEIKTYISLRDSLDIADKTAKNRYAAVQFQTEKKEKENLQLKAANAKQDERLAIESKRKWQLSAGLFAAIIALAVFAYYYQRNKKQKKVIVSLQKELHHRVKNNLSIIDSFIEVAKEEFEDLKFSNKLTELQNRIDSINKVHQQLYQNKDITNLNLNNYIDTLANNVASSFSNNKITIEKTIQEQLHLHADKSFPIGLIINEFLTNSYKYAFGANNGKVTIEMNDLGNNYELLLSDNGKGLPENFDLKTTESFGLRIMKLLTEQLNGHFKLTNNHGVELKINFPK